MFSALEASLLSLAHALPLELFVFVASFIEEVFAPIPSAAVLLVTGSLAAIQERSLLGLIPLALIAALGKTIGALVVYYFADKIGGLIITKFGRFFEITTEAIQRLGSKITGTKRDYLMLTVFRAIPVLPSAIISVGGGLLKIPLRIFIITTFLGTIVRDSIFLYVGYTGTKLLGTLATNSADIEAIVQAIIFALAFIVLVYFYIRRTRIAKKIL